MTPRTMRRGVHGPLVDVRSGVGGVDTLRRPTSRRAALLVESRGVAVEVAGAGRLRRRRETWGKGSHRVRRRGLHGGSGNHCTLLLLARETSSTSIVFPLDKGAIVAASCPSRKGRRNESPAISGCCPPRQKPCKKAISMEAYSGQTTPVENSSPG